MEKYVIFIAVAFIFGIIIGAISMYAFLYERKKARIQNQFEEDCKNNV